MKKIALLLTVFACSGLLQAKTLYLAPNENWKKDGARFAIYTFGNGEGWYSMSAVNGASGFYQATIDDKYPQVIFCRMNPATSENNWGNKWNQTSDLTLETGKDLYTIAEGAWDKGAGTWSVYGGGDTPGGDDPVTPSDYSSAVPSECEDVMLQAFYWQSYSDNTYGGTRWATLTSKADEINANFDIVWLSPSGRGDGMGYIPKVYSNQNNSMGSSITLTNLINALHAGGTKVLADVVINHAGNKSSWVDFEEQNFDDYGKFQPVSTWITSDDEAKGHGTLGSNADDGQESNRNYGSARDWDHKNENVQKMCRAYLKWLKNVIGYDGFRFDYCGGYHVSHINDYVSAAKPYFSVMEYWNGNATVLSTRIVEASRNTLTFDFAEFYTAFQQGIAVNNYSKLIKPGLRGVGAGYTKYAVTFVDNHDTFNRADIGNTDCGNSKDGKTSLANKELILQCNAYLLSMPGVPCVFYPHWYTYKDEINAMIHARKSAGVHSESKVESETSGSGWYKATVVGKAGKVILYLGSAASEAAPEGYKQAVKSNKVAMYYTGDETRGLDEVENKEHGTKFIQDGQLLIRAGEKVYDAQGRLIR